ncbi:MAG: Tim44 domain-containing protein [Pseudorhodoplanes sp.]
MPQDADGSGLISLLWMTWAYCNIYWWLEYLASTSDSPETQAPSHPSGASIKCGAAPFPAAMSVPSNLEALVWEILRRDGTDRVEDFLSERLAAYEAVVAAFDSGDRRKLRDLVSGDVLDVLSNAIASREAERTSVETLFSQIDPPEIAGGLIDETHMEISIRFVGECFKLHRDSAGKPVGERPDRCRNIDVWTFARTLPSGGAWRVVATQADMP